jgi:hypothetical protein
VGKSRLKYLFGLIRTGDVDITNSSYKNIKDVRKEDFAHCDVKNFCHNFHDFAASLNLETKCSGARRGKGGKLHIFYFILMSRLSNIFPSLLFQKTVKRALPMSTMMMTIMMMKMMTMTMQSGTTKKMP